MSECVLVFSSRCSPLTCCLWTDPRWRWARRSPRTQSREPSCCGTATSAGVRAGRLLASVTVIEKQTQTETTGSKREDTNKVPGTKTELKNCWRDLRNLCWMLTRYGLGVFPLVLVCQRLKAPSASTMPNYNTSDNILDAHVAAEMFYLCVQIEK